MRYVFLFTLLVSQVAAFGQKHRRGIFVLQQPYFFSGISFFNNDSCVYHIATELEGKDTFHSTYTVHKGHIHINVAPPPDTQKTHIGFKNDNVENRTVKLLDCDGSYYIGANVVLNGQCKYRLDTTSSITLPQGFIIKTLEINYIDRPDTTLNIDDPGKGNMIAMIPVQYTPWAIYRYVVTDWHLKRTWLFGRQRIYAIRKGVMLKDYYLQRVQMKAKRN